MSRKVTNRNIAERYYDFINSFTDGNMISKCLKIMPSEDIAIIQGYINRVLPTLYDRKKFYIFLYYTQYQSYDSKCTEFIEAIRPKDWNGAFIDALKKGELNDFWDIKKELDELAQRIKNAMPLNRKMPRVKKKKLVNSGAQKFCMPSSILNRLGI